MRKVHKIFNTLSANNGDGFHLYGYVDSTVHRYYARENCWNYVGPHLALYRAGTTDTLPIPVIYYNYGFKITIG